jgi:teichuronic acid biosynthesis glycosyltransferase TuaH
VDVDHFAATESAVPARDVLAEVTRRCPGRATVVGLVGHLGDRIDAELVRAVAARGHAVLLVGPLQRSMAPARREALLGVDGVCWVGPRSYQDLPSILACADVWLLPYGDSEFNRASFPLKLLEYLAAGRRVVATDLPAVRWLETDLIAAASAPDSFADAVDAATATSPTAAERAARREFAADHSWARRVEVLARAIGLATDSRTCAPAASPASAASPAPAPIPTSPIPDQDLSRREH